MLQLEQTRFSEYNMACTKLYMYAPVRYYCAFMLVGQSERSFHKLLHPTSSPAGGLAQRRQVEGRGGKGGGGGRGH